MSGALCNLAVAADKDVLRKCPKHQKVEPARLRECYDRGYLFFDCGVTVDLAEREWWDGPKRRPQT